MTISAGLDVKGKVVVLISGSPADMAAALASHYQSTAERAKSLREAGAVGLISIPNPASMDIPWGRMKLARTRPSMALADPSLDDAAGIKLLVIFNPADAEKLFAGFRPQLPGDCRSGQRPQASADVSAHRQHSRESQGHQETSGVRQYRRQTAGHRS